MTKKLILVTNDDGIDSPGLHAAAEALLPLGDVLITAPSRQQSGMGQSLPAESTGIILEREMHLNGTRLTTYAIEGSPAQTVAHAILELADRKPDLVVSGVNFGENLSIGVTVSGTVGAALHGAHWLIPALAVSLQAPIDLMYHFDDTIDFSAAAHFTHHFAAILLNKKLPFDADLLKIDVPASATPQTPWRVTRLERNSYYHSFSARKGKLSEEGRLGFGYSKTGPSSPDTDTAAIEEGVVSVTPLSVDLTSRVDFTAFERELRDQD